MSFRILICDDHSAIRKGVKLILGDAFEGALVGEAINKAELENKLKESPWDLLILDVELPGHNGLEVLSGLREAGVNIPVLIFSMYPEEELAIQAIRTGAQGYLAKSAADKELVMAADVLLKGGKFITGTLAEKISMQLFARTGQAGYERLAKVMRRPAA